MIEFIKAIIFGIVEGITEWLPISSTGHMILLDKFMPLQVSPEFWEMFLVVVQLGAILAVVVIYWKRLFPFYLQGETAPATQNADGARSIYSARDADGANSTPGAPGIHSAHSARSAGERQRRIRLDIPMMAMWGKIVIASVPAAILGLFFDEQLNALFYNEWTVAIMLILFGILFIVIENSSLSKNPRVHSIGEISCKAAFFIGIFQMIAAVFPGTSRSGATIVGALLLGISRTAAAEFTFFLAIPAMLGGSALKLVKFGFHFTSQELLILVTGMAAAYVVSVIAIKFLMGYIKKHDFKVFGWYRIILGLLILGWFILQCR